VLYAGWIGRYLGGHLFGGTRAALSEGIALTVVAYLVERGPSGPLALVSFLPGSWLLVPGALSLIGTTEYLSRDAVRGSQDLVGAASSMVAIALGGLCGHPLYRSLARSLGWRERVRGDEAACVIGRVDQRHQHPVPPPPLRPGGLKPYATMEARPGRAWPRKRG
jgi:uncharacterized membrane protein YjjB (DUF3815 family)